MRVEDRVQEAEGIFDEREDGSGVALSAPSIGEDLGWRGTLAEGTRDGVRLEREDPEVARRVGRRDTKVLEGVPEAVHSGEEVEDEVLSLRRGQRG